MHYAEIEIHGDLMQRWQPAGTRIGNGRAVLGEHVVVAGDLVRQIDAAEAEGIRSLLVVLEGEGGDHAAGLDVYSRLRRFSRSGGHTIAFIRGRCMSTLPLVAAACDRVLMSPAGRFGIHAAHAPAGREKDAEEANAAQVALLAARTPVPRAKLESWTSEVDAVVDVHAAGSVRLGLADAEATLEAARSIAEAVGLDPHALDAPRYVTKRSTYLATGGASHDARPASAVAPGVACGHNTQSSDGSMPQWIRPPPEVRIHEVAAQNWTALTTMPMVSGQHLQWSSIVTRGTVTIAFGSGAAYTTPDLVTWTARTFPYTGIVNDSIYISERFIAVGTLSGGYAAATSTGDGSTWTARTLPGTTGGAEAVANASGRLCAVGSGPYCATSDDGGVTWTQRTTIPTGTWKGLAHSPSVGSATQGRLVAVGYTTGPTAVCATSDDGGLTWTSRTVPATSGNYYQGAVWVDALRSFVIVGLGVVPAYSADGITWSEGWCGASMTNVSLRRVVWTGHVLIAIPYMASGGRVFISSDAKTWHSIAAGIPVEFAPGLAWVNGRAVVVTSTGSITGVAAMISQQTHQTP